MKRFLCIILVLLASPLLGATAAPAAAIGGTIKTAESDQVRACPASARDTQAPDFEAADCRVMPLSKVDPQQKHLWIAKTVSVSQSDRDRFIGVLVSAKASSKVYLNGVLLGNNGKPGDRADDEILGQMDTVLPIPRGLLKSGDNQLVLRMSSHNGWLALDNPIHALMLVPYLVEQDQILRQYLPALLPLGAFLLASFYFISMTLRSERKDRAALLSALSVLAALQLLIEISRGVFAYHYPLHDMRLIGILLCSVLIGLSLVALLSRQFTPKSAQLSLLIAATIAIGGVIAWAQDMDDKARIALLIASAFGLGIAIYGVRQRMPQAGAHAWALMLFGALNILAQDMFLDVYLFYLIAALLVFLMVQQASAYAREIQLQREQRTRADRLQAALDDRMQAKSELILTVLSVGKMQRIAASSIAHIQGAGDYVELHLIGGTSLLHTIGLNELEAQLPSYFLRVHRSHIVNTRLVDRLQQAEGGNGSLFLSGGKSVPVSRRIMPGVRKALK